MTNKKIYLDKHYRIPKEIFEKLQLESPTHLKKESDIFEYYLLRGLMYDERYKEQDKINNKIIKEIQYIKYLLEQLFSNISFSENVDRKTNELLKEFKNSFVKDKYFE